MNSKLAAYLPSRSFVKKLLVILGCLVLLVGLNTLITYVRNRQSVVAGTATTAPSAKPITIGDVTALDSNNDGLPDWQDGLMGIDSTSTASDPRAKLALQAANSSSDMGNETDQFAKDLFSTAASLSQAGDVTDQGAQALAESAVANINNVPEKNFTLNDIKTTPSTATAAFTAYVSGVTKILQNDPQKNDQSLLILQAALDAGDPTKLSQLDPTIKNYRAAITAMQKLTVPPSFVQSHILIMNALEHIADALDTFKTVFDNPILSMGTIYKYAGYLNDYGLAVQSYTQVLAPYTN